MENHNIDPVWNSESEILILGSFPSVKSREAQFFYAHPQNRFWRMLAAVYDETPPATVDEKKRLLLSHRLALWDVIRTCDITGSADVSIKNAVPNDIPLLIASSAIRFVICNGQTAFRLYRRYLESVTGLPAVVLPSTSPANASFSLQKLTEEWRKCLKGTI